MKYEPLELLLCTSGTGTVERERGPAGNEELVFVYIFIVSL